MRQCDQLRLYRDGEMTVVERWRMQLHLRRCRACMAQSNVEETLCAALIDPRADTAEEAAAIARVERAWLAAMPQTVIQAAPVRRPRFSGRWMTASAAVGFTFALFAVAVITGPSRAIAQVQNAMSKVQCFHIRMDVNGYDLRYEAWGERGKATRVEEREDGKVSMVVVDDGKTLRRFDPEEMLVRESATRLKSVFRDAAGFQASKMLSKAARGRLFDGQDWLGEAEAKEVAKIRRDGAVLRRIQVDLKDGYFARMVIFASTATDRLLQANLYLDRQTPEDEPFARVYFDYPDHVDPKLFELKLPGKLPVRKTEEDLRLP